MLAILCLTGYFAEENLEEIFDPPFEIDIYK